MHKVNHNFLINRAITERQTAEKRTNLKHTPFTAEDVSVQVCTKLTSLCSVGQSDTGTNSPHEVGRPSSYALVCTVMQDSH